VYAYGNDHTHEPDVNEFFVANVFNDIRGNIAKRTSKRNEFLVRSFALRKDEQRGIKGGK